MTRCETCQGHGIRMHGIPRSDGARPWCIPASCGDCHGTGRDYPASRSTSDTQRARTPS